MNNVAGNAWIYIRRYMEITTIIDNQFAFLLVFLYCH